MFKLAAFGIITDKQNRILQCHRRDYDLWNLPGGTVETNESPWDTVVREIKEETGFDTSVQTLAGVYSKPEKNEIVFSFECKIISGIITLNEEARDIQYFSLHDIPRNTSPNQVERIKDLFEQGNEVIMKIQTGKSSIELIKEGKL